jgi:hypothetical protein
MKIRAYILVVVVLVLFIGSQARSDSTASREYQVKAAFLYNFIKFIEWPKEKVTDSNEPMIIGVIGQDPFGNAFDPLETKDTKSKKVFIKRFKSWEELKKSGEKDKSSLERQVKAIQKCHLLFICPSEEKNLKEVLNLVKGHSILTVGETKGFLEAGGIINFVMEEKKVRFEINVTTAKKSKLEVRSQLLRLAKKVVSEENTGGDKNG